MVQRSRFGINETERFIIRLIVRGLRYQDIAARRGTSEKTIKCQACLLYRKLQLNRSQVIALFATMGENMHRFEDELDRRYIVREIENLQTQLKEIDAKLLGRTT